MIKFATALVLTCAMALPATASGFQANGQPLKLIEYTSDLLPPTNWKSQWWTSPQNCQYSRAGRPGETVWYLIVNTAHAKCPVRLIQRAYSDYK
ncbi:MAG: hypothetical protein AB8B47_14925 [Roseobacter sp.]